MTDTDTPVILEEDFEELVRRSCEEQAARKRKPSFGWNDNVPDEPKTSEQPKRPSWVEDAYSLGADMIKAPAESPVTSEQPSETPSGHLRWAPRPGKRPAFPVLQQMFYVTTYNGLNVEQREEWRDVPVVSEP